MFPDENGLRRALAQRTFRAAEEIWPGIRKKLIVDGTRGSRRAGWSIAALILIVVLLFLRRGQPAFHRPRVDSGSFGVANVRSLGRPVAPIVLRPDSRTLMVVVD